MLLLVIAYAITLAVLLGVAVFVPSFASGLIRVALGVSVVGGGVLIYLYSKLGDSHLRHLVRLYLQRLEEVHGDFEARRKLDRQVSDLVRFIHDSLHVSHLALAVRKKAEFFVVESHGVDSEKAKRLRFGHHDELVRAIETRRSMVSLRKVYGDDKSFAPLNEMHFDEALPVLAGGKCSHFILMSRSGGYPMRLLRPFLLALADQIGNYLQVDDLLNKHNQQVARLRRQLDSMNSERESKPRSSAFDAKAMIGVQDRLMRIHNRDQLFDSLLHLFKDQFKVDFALALLKNPESGSYELKHSQNVSKDRADKMTWVADGGFIASQRETPGFKRIDQLPNLSSTPALAQSLGDSGVTALGALGEGEIADGLLAVGRQKAPFTDEELEVAYSYCRLFNLVLENQAHFEKIEQMSYTDPMTGLYNYRYFYKRLQEEITRAKRFDRRLALVIFDIDEFKVFNDTYGHQAGDYLLEQLGRLLAKSVRSIDVVSRYGGEEFCVIMPESSAEDCVNFMDRMRLTVRNHEFRDRFTSTQHQIAVSLGGAIYPNDAQRIDRLIYCADMALLQAKSSGKNMSVMFDKGLLNSREDGHDKKAND